MPITEELTTPDTREKLASQIPAVELLMKLIEIELPGDLREDIDLRRGVYLLLLRETEVPPGRVDAHAGENIGHVVTCFSASFKAFTLEGVAISRQIACGYSLRTISAVLSVQPLQATIKVSKPACPCKLSKQRRMTLASL